MLPATASKPGPDALDHLKALGLDDPNLYVTNHRFPLIDAHPPIRKLVRDPSAATRDNPNGLVWRMLEVTPEDLETIAANTNRLVVAGRPPAVQLGHAPLEDMPEEFQPKPVGRATNFVVGELGGTPWLFADLHRRRDRLDESSDYPNLSVERADWMDESSHHIAAIAMLRRQPERPVPLIPYGAGPAVASLRVFYGREVAAPPKTTPSFAEWCRSRRLPQTSESLRRFTLAEGRAAAEIEADAVLARRRLQEEYLDFATTRGIGDPREAQRRWLESRAGKG